MDRIERFMIASAARTGSTMLRRMLDSHPAIACHGEIFAVELWGLIGLGNPNDQVNVQDACYQALKRLREEAPGRFLREAIWPAAPPPVGFKFLYKDMEDPKWARATQALAADREVAVVHLLRENRLKRLISQTVMNRAGYHSAYEDHYINLAEDHHPMSLPAAPRPFFRFTLSPEECVRDFQTIEAAEARLRRRFSDHRVFELSYEQVVDPAGGRLAELEQWLGVEPGPLRNEMRKVNSNDPRDHLENFAELQRFFANTPYARFFE
ncbi:MAG: sulfotransferase [Candidatus Sumerlaeota bacterium]|nr:sulfotransferase [Candidatus Sumerlaeota bacterium]